MAKKDFSAANINPVYSAIAEATADPAQDVQEQQAVQEAAPAQQAQAKTRKSRKTYTDAEKAEILQTMQTSGRKGVKLPRINLAFAPDVYEYVQTLSRVRGETLTAFVNEALRQHMEEHIDIYSKAIEFRNSL